MSELGPLPDPDGASQRDGGPAGAARETPEFRIGEQRLGRATLLALIAMLGFGTWFIIEMHRGSSPVNTTSTPATQARGPVASTPAQLKALATELGYPVYWVGPRANTIYELTLSSSGQSVIRYLPMGVPIGSKQEYLTVGTYPVANAFAATNSLTGSGTVTIQIPGGGIAEYPNGHANDIHLAYPGGAVQIEVFDPSPAVPPKLASSGAVVPVS